VIVFVFIVAIFSLYDKFIQKRQDVVASQAKRARPLLPRSFQKVLRCVLSNKLKEKKLAGFRIRRCSKTFW
jgi:hypothetical protein